MRWKLSPTLPGDGRNKFPEPVDLAIAGVIEAIVDTRRISEANREIDLRPVEVHGVGRHIVVVGLDRDRLIINPQKIKVDSAVAVLADRDQAVVLVIEINPAARGVNQVL